MKRSMCLVLSGFVIAYVTDRTEINLSSYAVARLARIVP